MTFSGEVLEDRQCVLLSGEDCTDFLEGLFTCDVVNLKINESAFGALLSPQGKILFDFFLVRTEDGYIADLKSENCVWF